VNAAKKGFTLIEVMLAVLLLALLASAAAMSFSQPLRAARSQDALDQLRSFDAAARRAAVSSGRNVRMIFDLSSDTLVRRDGVDLGTLRVQMTLPLGYRVDQVRIGGHTMSSGENAVDVSSLGLTRTYALRLGGPSLDQWVLFAGMSGQTTTAQDEATLDSIFDPITPRHDAD
jgi:prepilin-type N-terminal cleavage/methylation domain-containing protein